MRGLPKGGSSRFGEGRGKEGEQLVWVSAALEEGGRGEHDMGCAWPSEEGGKEDGAAIMLGGWGLEYWLVAGVEWCSSEAPMTSRRMRGIRPLDGDCLWPSGVV